MKVFHCNHCRQLIFFENVRCENCGHQLAYLPDIGEVASLDKIDGEWQSPHAAAQDKRYRLCRNYSEHNVCNWAISQNDLNDLCESCRLTETIPDLSVEGQKAAWYKLEVAKRRLIYSINGLKLPIIGREVDEKNGLAFEFLADSVDPQQPRVLTGHANGLITVNIAEADDAEREKRRLMMHEPYRTLLGHFRHEIGHYYWNILINDSKWIGPYRKIFGDERVDYAEAVKKHYENGPPEQWQSEFVSAYSSMHPWEDWAETFAHYLHITDTLETAADCGVQMRPDQRSKPAIRSVTDPVSEDTSFDKIMDAWHPLTYLLNNLNRGLGLPDAYPFVLSLSATEKLRFVHVVVRSQTQIK